MQRYGVFFILQNFSSFFFEKNDFFLFLGVIPLFDKAFLVILSEITYILVRQPDLPPPALFLLPVRIDGNAYPALLLKTVVSRTIMYTYLYII